MASPPPSWTPIEIATMISRPGWLPVDDWRIVTVLAVLWQESRGNPLAVGPPIWAPGTFAHRSIALGLCQLLTAAHVDAGPYPNVPRMTVAECFDPYAAWARMWLVMNRDRPDRFLFNLKPWSAYTTGAYRQHLPLALAAVRAIGGTI
jgi:hypothetical protein